MSYGSVGRSILSRYYSTTLSVSRKKKSNSAQHVGVEMRERPHRQSPRRQQNKKKKNLTIPFIGYTQKLTGTNVIRSLTRISEMLIAWSKRIFFSILFLATTYFQFLGGGLEGCARHRPCCTFITYWTRAECVCVCVPKTSGATVRSCHRRLLPPPYRTDIIDVYREREETRGSQSSLAGGQQKVPNFSPVYIQRERPASLGQPTQIL